MARRPVRPRRRGLGEGQLPPGRHPRPRPLAALFDGADVAVHLAFVIFGSREETRRVNLEGTRNVFEAAVEAGVKRLVYASSVAAYGFHAENPQPLTEDVPRAGSEGFYYSRPEGGAGGACWASSLAGSGVEAYVFRPCDRRRAAGDDADRAGGRSRCRSASARADAAPRLLGALPLVRPVLPDAGVPLPARPPRRRRRGAAPPRSRATGEPGAYNLAGDGEIALADIARALDWHSVPVPRLAVGVAADARRAALLPLGRARVGDRAARCRS